MRALALVLALTLAAGAAAADPAPVRVEQGLLQGVQTAGTVSYKGVPYAAPPAGAMRWKPPAPAPAWSGVRPAEAFGPICPQAPDPPVVPPERMSEDCLTLNVWAPAEAHGAPVMVWIHGGGDNAGTASRPEFDGTPFARDGVVFVSVEYRLGVLGWFAHPALTREAGAEAPLANYGLMDQIAALGWVKRNIAAFGGDPARVTVAGESAGGEAIQFLMTSAAGRGLFSQAIVESGVGWARHPALDAAEAAGVETARKAGTPTGTVDANLLRLLPLSALLAAGENAESGVVIDGRLVRDESQAVFARGQALDVPLLIGTNSGEDNLTGGDPNFLASLVADVPEPDRAALRAAYGAEAAEDTGFGRALFRDRYMAGPARWVAGAEAGGATAYLYRFAYIPLSRRIRVPRAGHGSEMLFVFEALDRAPAPLRFIADADKAQMTMVHACWAAFVKTAKPACAGAPEWPPYTREGDLMMEFGPDGPHIVGGFQRPVYDILERLEAPRLGRTQ